MTQDKKFDLENKKWGKFEIGKIFDIENIKPYHKNNLQEFEGVDAIPYITRTVLNNGLETFIKDQNFELNDENCIVFGAESADFFYQPFKFLAGNKMYLAKNKKLSRYGYLFVVMVFRKNIKGGGFGYGKGLTGTRFKTRKILLPIDDSGNPDWDFMENYMKQIEADKLQHIISYYKQKCIENDLLIRTHTRLDNNEKYWKEFLIEEVFEISTGATISQKDLKNGNIPRITVSDNNNGVSLFTTEEDHKNFRTLENFISISFLGSVFYHPYKASLDMKVHAIKPKDFQFNRYIVTFLINLLKNFTQKYSYGYQLSTSILKKQKIILPVDENGNLDGNYMENYMKNIEEKTLKEVVKYFEERLKITENSGGGENSFR